MKLALVAASLLSGAFAASKSWAGTSNYFLQGLSASDQQSYIQQLASDGIKAIRLWVSDQPGGNACVKGSISVSGAPELETTLGQYNTQTLDLLDQTLVWTSSHGIKAIISPHDGNKLNGPNGYAPILPTLLHAQDLTQLATTSTATSTVLACSTSSKRRSTTTMHASTSSSIIRASTAARSGKTGTMLLPRLICKMSPSPPKQLSAPTRRRKAGRAVAQRRCAPLLAPATPSKSPAEALAATSPTAVPLCRPLCSAPSWISLQVCGIFFETHMERNP